MLNETASSRDPRPVTRTVEPQVAVRDALHDSLQQMVAAVLDVEKVTFDEDEMGKLPVTMRAFGGHPTAEFVGRLRVDSEAAYDQLDANFRTLQHTPVFREDNGRHVVLALRGRIDPAEHGDLTSAVLEVRTALRERLRGRALKVLIEPGRAIVGNAGVLLTRVEYLKHTPHKNFAIVDAGMNDLLRPALYEAWQAIVPVAERDGELTHYDVVGPVCETGDFLGKDRPLCIAPGDLLAVRSAGAYGFSMSSTYNSRPRAAELMVDGAKVHVVRERERVEDLMRGENVLPK